MTDTPVGSAATGGGAVEAGVEGLPGRVMVIGSGLIGTSIGLALRARGVEVLLEDRTPRAVSAAVERGAGTRATGSERPDVVVVAVPPGAVVDVAVKALGRFPEATVCDVASSKKQIIDGVRALSGSDDRFVGSHPMAGREVSGPGAAEADLFEGRRWVITPTARNPQDRIGQVAAVAEACGALVVRMSAQSHDRAVALTSHTPQLVASVMAAQLAHAPRQDVMVSGQGLRDTTRIADGDPALWTEILASNAAEVGPVLERLISDLAEASLSLRDVPQDGPSARRKLAEVLKRGKRGRDRLPAKHGGLAPKYRTVAVVVADRPGELGRLFDTAGQAGVNLEDVRIEHSVGRPDALVELSVVPDSEQALVTALGAGGWRVREQ